MINRRPTPAEIESIIQQAQRERSRLLGEYLALGWQAVRRSLSWSFRVAQHAAAMNGARSPEALRLRLREYERNPG